MPRQNEIFYLDINKAYSNFAFRIKQFVDVTLHIALIQNNRPFNVSNCNITMHIEGPNNYSSSINSTEIIGNDIKFNLDQFTELGTYISELTISDLEGTIRTPSFYFSVSKSISNNKNIEYFNLVDSEGFNLVDSEGFMLQVKS